MKDKHSNVWEQPYFKINIKKIKPFFSSTILITDSEKYKILFDRIWAESISFRVEGGQEGFTNQGSDSAICDSHANSQIYTLITLLILPKIL